MSDGDVRAEIAELREQVAALQHSNKFILQIAVATSGIGANHFEQFQTVKQAFLDNNLRFTPEQAAAMRDLELSLAEKLQAYRLALERLSSPPAEGA